MASPATARVGSLHPDDWIHAAEARLSGQGIESVRVEVLARDLGVSKGSFYWHFRDRSVLLDQLLARWEASELGWLDQDDGAGGPARWAGFIERTASPERMRMEVALRAWARGDQRVATRVTEIEKRKAHVVTDVLRNIGFAQSAAEATSQVVLLICLGWVDRATRDKQFDLASRSLGEVLSQVILAASTGAPVRHR
jgi:AcrR family transcriptional regulator